MAGHEESLHQWKILLGLVVLVALLGSALTWLAYDGLRRARAYGAGGDALGEDPSCSYGGGAAGGAPVSLPPAGPVWTEEAERLLAAIPSFVRGRVASRVERYARERGIERITVAVMGEARGAPFLGARPPAAAEGGPAPCVLGQGRAGGRDGVGETPDRRPGPAVL